MVSGLLPFIAASYLTLPGVNLVTGTEAEFIIISYGAVILSFLGGIRWGAALQNGPPAVLFGSVLPSLAGFVSLLLVISLPRIAMPWAILVLLAGFASQAAWDYFAPGPLPAWFVRLRILITSVVIVCLLVALSL